MQFSLVYKRRAVGLVGVLGLISACGLAATAERVAMFESVEMKLTLGPTELLVGQPLYFQILLTHKNPEASNIPVFSSRLQLPEGNDVDVFVQAPGESEVRLEGAMEAGIYSGNAIEVPPGRAVNYQMPLIYDKNQQNGYIFSKPGEYNVRVQLRFSLSSDPTPRKFAIPNTRITVREPEGRAADAWKLLNNAEAAKALQLNRIGDDAVRKAITQVGDQYIDTPYGKAAARAVAVSAAYSNPQKADLNQTLDVLRKYEKTYRQDADTDLIVYTIAASYHLLQQYDAAREWLFYLMEKYPSSALVRKQDPLINYYYIAPAEAAVSFPWYLLEKPWIVPGAKPPTDLRPIQS
jgi:hypothetical protein